MSEPKQQPEAAPKQVPLGKPLEWSEKDLDALAEVTPADVAEAEAWAERNARPKEKGLWKARPTEEK